MDEGTAKRSECKHRSWNRSRRTCGFSAEDNADFVMIYPNLRRVWGEHLENFRTFFMSMKGSFTLKHFTFNLIADAYQKEA